MIGDLKIWWIPQIPGKSFDVPVRNLREADLLLDVLAQYDSFQFENKIKPDYCNVGGLLVLEEESEEGNEWVDWHSEDGEDFDEYRQRMKEEGTPP